jgi:hypothetical protein
MKRLVIAAAFVVAMSHARDLYAREVVLIGGGKELRDAVSVTLTPWNLHVVPSEAPVPPADVPRATKEAHAIAWQSGAAGVVWIGDHALVVYDAENDQLVSRALAQLPPYDAPTAAAIALSVKTLLRSSTVAPVEERIGAEAAAKPPPAPEPKPEIREPPAPPPPPRTSFVSIEVGGAVRAVAKDADTRISLGGAFWSGRFGTGLAVRIGPGLGVVEPRFRGHFDEITVAPSLRYRQPLASWLRVEPRVGASLHATRIDGVAIATAKPADAKRLDVGVDLGGVLDFGIARTAWLGLDLDGSYILRYQRYFVGSAPVLTLAPVQGSVGLRLSMVIE